MEGLNYELFVGDGLNTLTVPTGKIDPHLLCSGSLWWEPLGTYGIPGTQHVRRLPTLQVMFNF
jgi:hypothetical protein